MSAFGGDSPLSDAPSSNSPAGSSTSSPAKSPTPPSKSKKKPVKAESASSSRRSSRIEDRSQSPEKLSASGPAPSIKLKFTRPPSPDKVALGEIPEEAGAGLEKEKEKEKGKRGKKRKSDAGGAEGELREAIGSGKGKKKVKVTHGDDEDEPRKKNVAIKKKSLSGVGSGVRQTQSQSATDLISGMFTDDDDDDDIGDGVKEKEEVVKPVIKIKGKPGHKPKADRDQDGDVKMGGEVDEERPSKSSKSSEMKAARRVEEGTEIQANPIEPNPIGNTESTSSSTSKSKSQSKKTKRDATEVQVPSADETAEGEKHVPGSNPAPKARGRPKKVHAETSTVDTKAPPVPPAPAPVDIVSKQDKEEFKEPASDPTSTIATDTVKPKKSFAQVVAGSPPLDSKKERKPLPTIQKLNKSVSGGTPDKRVTSVGSTTSGPGTGTNTPTTKKMVPAQKKKEVSLLESTMASLLGGGSKSTPKKEEKETPKSTPKVIKDRPKGQWTDEWVLTPTQQREVLESRDEREREREKRMSYRKNPVNLQEAKDSYRLDSTKSRVIPALPHPLGGLGVKTQGAPSMMLKALIERNQSRSQSQSV